MIDSMLYLGIQVRSRKLSNLFWHPWKFNRLFI